MLEILQARPPSEAVWTSLRRLFDVVDDHDQATMKLSQRMVFETPALLAVYLQKLQRIQTNVADELLRRADAAGKPYPRDDIAPRAVTAAAFGCFITAQYAWLEAESSEALGGYIDSAMATVKPRG